MVKKRLFIGVLAAVILLACITPLGARLESLEQYLETVINTYTLWLIHLGIDNLELVSTQLEQAVTSYPEGVKQNLLLGVTYLGQGKTQEAIAAYEKVLAMGPEYQWVKALIGEIYLKQGQYDLAEALFREVVDADIESALALKGLGLCAERRGEDVLAMEYYERSLEIAPMRRRSICIWPC